MSMMSATNETAQPRADGRELTFDWPMNEAVIFSFAGPPPRP